MKDIEHILLSFDIHKRLTESAAYPLVAYGVINYISAKELHEYFTDNKLKVSLSSIQNWRRNAAKALGLQPSSKGRQSYADQKSERESWHAKYGYPTIKMLMNGWSIQQSPRTSNSESELRKKELSQRKSSSASTRSDVANEKLSPSTESRSDEKRQKTISMESNNSASKSETVDVSKFIKKTNKSY